MIDQEELAHFKRECLILAIALKHACLFATIMDEQRSSKLYDLTIQKARAEVNQHSDQCVHKTIYQNESIT